MWTDDLSQPAPTFLASKFEPVGLRLTNMQSAVGFVAVVHGPADDGPAWATWFDSAAAAAGVTRALRTLPEDLRWSRRGGRKAYVDRSDRSTLFFQTRDAYDDFKAQMHYWPLQHIVGLFEDVNLSGMMIPEGHLGALGTVVLTRDKNRRRVDVHWIRQDGSGRLSIPAWRPELGPSDSCVVLPAPGMLMFSGAQAAGAFAEALARAARAGAHTAV